MINHFKVLTRRKFAKDTFWLTASQGVMVISGFLLNIVISHEFSQSELGTFNQVLGIYMILTVLFSLGINTSLAQKIASSPPDKMPQVFSSGIFITLISSTICVFVAYLILTYFPSLVSTNDVKLGVLLVLIGIPIFNLNKNFMGLYTGLRKQLKFSIVRMIRWVLIISFIFVNSFYFKDMNMNYYAFIFTEIAILIYVISDNLIYLTPSFKRTNILENLSFGIKSFVAELFAVLNRRLDVVIIGYFLTQSETGIYSFYIFFVKALYIFPGILQQNVNPIFAKHWKLGTIESIKKKLTSLKKINMVIVFSLSLFLILVYLILVYYFRTDYQNSLALLIVNMLSAIPAALIAWGGGLLVMAGKLRENIIRTVLILVVNTGFMFILSSSYGLYGAVAATSLGFIFTFIMLFTFVNKTIGINLLSIK